jgi:hypothetical protein
MTWTPSEATRQSQRADNAPLAVTAQLPFAIRILRAALLTGRPVTTTNVHVHDLDAHTL